MENEKIIIGKIEKDDRGWIKDSKGEFIHPDRVRLEDRLKSEMIDTILDRADLITNTIKVFKDFSYSEVEAYFSNLEKDYGITDETNKKKNFTLENYSKTAKIQVSVSENIAFDERLQIAKAKIDECLNEITKDSSADVQTLIKKAFEVDKKGLISPKKVLGLRSYDMKHPKWKEAMEIIADSITIDSSKEYIRYYVRKSPKDSYEQIALNISGV